MKNKTILKLFIIQICLGFINPASSFAITTLGKLNGFKLSTCVLKKCLEVKADSAESGQFSAIHILKNYKVTFINGKSIEKMDGAFAYLDFEANTLVLKTKNQDEIFVNMNNLERGEL